MACGQHVNAVNQGGTAVAVVTIETLEGRSLQQKQQLVAAITKAMVEIAHARPATVHIVIRDVPPTNWGLAGTLTSEQATGSDDNPVGSPGR
jgi:4-oxalocrotonate tautomerase